MKRYDYAIGSGMEDCAAMNEMVTAMNELAEEGYQAVGNLSFVYVSYGGETVNGYAVEYIATQLMEINVEG